jgi:predicted Fe-Mo cluster-binding NifX family protein
VPYRIAVASSDGKNIDLHFGHASLFRIYEINETDLSCLFIEERKLSEDRDANGCAGCGGHGEQRVGEAAKLFNDCLYLLTARIGPKPYEMLKRSGITALETPFDLKKALPKLNAYHVKFSMQ